MRNFILNILMMIGFIFLVPVIITATIGFSGQLSTLPDAYQEFFMAGIITYLILHLFLAAPIPVFNFGQRTIAVIFGFYPPLASVLAFALPVYSILFLASLYFASRLVGSSEINHYLFFFAGFSLALHVILCARNLMEDDKSALKAKYLFSQSLIYIINLIVVAILLGLNFQDFSISGFLQSMLDLAVQIYQKIYNQLFGL